MLHYPAALPIRWQGLIGVGILVHAQMRLMPETASGNVDGAKFIGSISGDLYTAPTVEVDPSGTNPGLATPRMRYLTGNWSTYYSSTLTPDQLRAHPPPLSN